MIKTLTALATAQVIALGCIGALSTDVAQAQSEDDTRSTAEIALSNDTLQLRYITSGKLVGVDQGRLSGTFFLSEERDVVFSAGLVFPTSLEFGRLSVLVGPQVYAALLEDENQDVMSLSLGAELRYLLNEKLDLAVSGYAYYAPDILTFGSADNLHDFAARVELGLAPRVTLFGGMRWFEFDLTEGQGTRTLQQEVFVGLGYQF